MENTSNFTLIPLDHLINSPWQGRFIPKAVENQRLDDRSLQQLINSIKERGLMTPIVVRGTEENGVYEVVDGHRRIEAYRVLDIQSIESIVRKYSDEEAQVFSVIGNLQRKSLNLIEKAVAFQKILDAKLFETKEGFSKAIGKDETYVGDVLNLLKMDQRIINELKGNSSIKDVRILRAIRKFDKAVKNKSDKQWELYQMVSGEGLSRNQLAKYLKSKRKNISKPNIEFRKNKIVIVMHEEWSDEKKEKLRMLINEK